MPFKRRLLRDVIRAAVKSADSEAGGRVPVTVKFRLGIDDDHLTYLETARIAESEGVAAVALHARTALQHYAPSARWETIARLKDEVRTIPVLGNGDVFTAEDALRMLETTGCDGVVIGRGCLGRPWLFRDLAAAFAGEPVPAPPRLGEVIETIRRHVRLIVEWQGGEERLAHFRKHLAWYLKGYPVGGAVRAEAGHVSTVQEIESLLERLDPDAAAVDGVERIVRSHSNALRKVALPEGWLDDPDEHVALPRGAEALVSGG